jgi:hypothetical protein
MENERNFAVDLVFGIVSSLREPDLDRQVLINEIRE